MESKRGRILHLSLLLLLWCVVPLWAADVQTNIGSEETVQTLNGLTAISCGNAARHRTVRIVGNAAPVDLSALTPQIVAGTSTSGGELCDLYCESATNTVTLAHGNGVALLRGSGTFVCGDPSHGRRLPLSWSVVDSVWKQRGPAFDVTDNFHIAPPSDTNFSVTTTGAGEFLYNTLPVRAGSITLMDGYTEGDGTLGAVTAVKPFCIEGATLKECHYEAGGNWFTDVTTLDDVGVSTGLDIAAGLTHTWLGDGIDLLTLNGTTAAATLHGTLNYCLDAVGTDTYACAMVPALDRYVTGGMYYFKAATVNTGAASINFNTLGAKTIVKVAGGITTALADNDIRAGQVVALQYDGTNMQMQSTLGNAAAGSGDITDVWGCTTGNCNALTGAAGDSLSAASADSIIPNTLASTLPGTCTEGQQHQDTDSGGTETYKCTATNTWVKLAPTPVPLATDVSGTLPVANGGTGLTTGTSGGIPYYSATAVLSSSAALTANAVLVGGGAGVAPTPLASLGTSGHVLTSNGAGTPPSFQAAAAGGGSIEPIRPVSAVPSGSGAYSCPVLLNEMLCVTDFTTLTADVKWHLKFNIPAVKATGCTYKLRVDLMTVGAPGTQVISLRPEWNTWAYGATRASLALNSETVTADQVGGNGGSGNTVGVVAGDNGKLMYAEWTMDASTLTANQPVAMDLVVVDATYTLAVPFGMDPYLICE